MRVEPGTVRLPDGRALRTLEGGSGDPLVVFESGGGVCLPVWLGVQRRVAARTRTLSYDRAGYGGSDDDRAPRTLSRIVDDLAGLLAATADAPAVLVGASFGGLILRAFARAHPEAAGAAVLVDPTTTALVPPRTFPVVRAVGGVIAGLSRAGLHRPLVRAAVGPGRVSPGDGPDDAALLAAVEDGRGWRAGFREMREADPEMAELLRLEAAGFPPGLPVTIVVGGRADRRERRTRPAHVAFTRREMAAHPRGRHVVAAGSSHYVPWQEPALVADEVLRAVALLRGARH